MERWREGFHLKGKIYQEDAFLWCIQRRMKLVIHAPPSNTCNACTNQLASSIVFRCLSQSCRTGSF